MKVVGEDAGLPRFELLTRPGCGLCRELLLEAEGELARRGLPLAIVQVDVDGDPELRRRFGWHVPVLLADGAVLCAHRLDHGRLGAALDGGAWEPLELGEPTPAGGAAVFR